MSSPLVMKEIQIKTRRIHHYTSNRMAEIYKFFYLFLRERERETETERQRERASMRGGGAEREGDTESKAGSRV